MSNIIGLCILSLSFVVHSQFIIIWGLIISCFLTISITNPVFAIIGLIASFALSAILMIFQEAEFLGLVYLVVYIGAIAVLFLFVSMMLEIDSTIVPNVTIFQNQNQIAIQIFIKLSIMINILLYITAQTIWYYIFNQQNLLTISLDSLYLNSSQSLLNHLTSINLKMSTFWEITNFNLMNSPCLVILGKLFYLNYSVIFLTLGSLLTVAMILTVILSIDNRITVLTRYQIINRQLSVSVKHNLRHFS